MKGRMMKSATLLVSLLTAGTLQAAPLRCVIEPDRVADVGSPVVGVVESIRVERGDLVREGQLLASLRANVERASVGAAETRAQAEADVRGAQANYEFMRQKLTRAEELVQKNFISQQALDQELRQRSIRAPFDGIVADRYVNVGERVEERPMFRIAKINPLRVEVIVPAAQFGTIRAGTFAKVTTDMPNSAAVKAKVVLVDKLVDPASNTFRVRAELSNADGSVTSGLRCKAEFLDAPHTDPAAAPAPDTSVQKLKVTSKVDSAIPRDMRR